MNETVIVSIISLIGTLVGSLIGVLTANKLVNYRISQLEKKVDKHNNLIDRTYNLEKEVAVLKEEVKDIDK